MENFNSKNPDNSHLCHHNFQVLNQHLHDKKRLEGKAIPARSMKHSETQQMNMNSMMALYLMRSASYFLMFPQLPS